MVEDLTGSGLSNCRCFVRMDISIFAMGLLLGYGLRETYDAELLQSWLKEVTGILHYLLRL